MNIENKFSINLDNVIWATEKQKNTEHWNISGRLKKISNQEFKFDLRHLSNFPQDKIGKLVNSESKADKVLFEDNKNWILIDTQELIKYMKEHGLKEVKLEELIDNIHWNILLPKK